MVPGRVQSHRYEPIETGATILFWKRFNGTAYAQGGTFEGQRPYIAFDVFRNCLRISIIKLCFHFCENQSVCDLSAVQRPQEFDRGSLKDLGILW